MVANAHRDKLDRFYTMPHVVDICLGTVSLDGYVVVEPSAGDGAFSDKMPGCVAIDISPAREGILQQDFLRWRPPAGRIAIIGNPPYGVSGSLLTLFIKKACVVADMVGFILPLSYAKESMHSRWPKRFHLVAQVILPSPNATFERAPAKTRNVWQVWQKMDCDRETSEAPIPIGWKKTTPELADVALRTVGRVGCLSDPLTANRTSHLFIKFDRRVDKEKLNAALAENEWPDLNMAQQSIGSRDFVPVINRFLKLADL